MIFRNIKPVDNKIEEQIVESFVYSEEQLMARLKFFIGICLTLTLFGIVFVVLYSLIFVTQPLNAISPIDAKFFEVITPIATFLTGTLSGIMLAGGDKDAQKQALAAANKGWDRPPAPIAPTPSTPSSSSFGSAPSSFASTVPATFGAAPAPAAFGGGFPSAPIAMTASGKKIVPDFPQPEI